MLLKRIIPLALLSVLLVACASAATQAPATAVPATAAPIKIGLITKTDTNPFFVKMKEGAQAEAAAKGAVLIAGAGKSDGDNEGQITLIENMINAGVKGIMITASDSKAIVPAIQKARAAGVLVIALDTALDPVDASDALFATDNFKAGLLIGQWAKGAMAGKTAIIGAMDHIPGVSVGIQRHNGFMQGFGLASNLSLTSPDYVNTKEVVCSQMIHGDTALAQTAMENCLQKNPDINLVYTINEPAALGGYQALKSAGKNVGTDVIMVSVDGGCDPGVKGIQDGWLGATSQQYPLKMASMGVDAIVNFALTGQKVSGYTDTGVTLITDKPVAGVDSIDSKKGMDLCWGTKPS